MKPTANGLAYRDQEAAEAAADQRRWAHIALLNDLEQLNKSLDSHKLHELIAREWAELSK